MAHAMPEKRRWWTVDPGELAVLLMFGLVVVAVLLFAEVRRQLRAIPETGRAVPIEELREIWADERREALYSDPEGTPMHQVTFPERRGQR